MFFKCWSLLSDLSDGTLGINDFRGVFSWPLGYVIIRVQVEGVWGYEEDQVALVVPDSTGFGYWVPVTLGMPNINQIISVIKESETDELSVSLNGIVDGWTVGLLASRTFDSEGNLHKLNCRPSQLEQGDQDN